MPPIMTFCYIIYYVIKTRNIVKRYYSEGSSGKKIILSLFMYPIILFLATLASILSKVVPTTNAFVTIIINVIFNHGQTLWITMYYCYNSPNEIKTCFSMIFTSMREDDEINLYSNIEGT